MGSWKGITLEQGQVVILDLCGTLVYIEGVTQTCLTLVALPEQPPHRTDERVFTPGRVGAKKLSPYARGTVVPIADLSERNKTFIGTYEALRAAHGVNHVDRTPEELAAQAAVAQPPPKVDRAARQAEKKAERDQRKADRLAARGAKLGVQTPRYKQTCQTCGQQPGHPDHKDQPDPDDGKHAFVPPADAPADEPDAPKAPKPPKAPRAAKPSKGLPPGPFAFVGDDASLTTLAAVNPKYKEGNSGAEIVRTIRENGDAGVDLAGILADLASHPRWSTVPQERIEFALGQLLAAGLIKVVVP